MQRIHKTNLLRRAIFAAAFLSFAGCEVGSQTHPNSPYRAPVSGNSGVSTGSSRAEVGSSIAVSVAVKDKSGYGIPNVVPTVTAVNNTTGLSTGVTSGGCGSTDSKGNANCTIRATVAGDYKIKTISPVVTTTSSTVTFYQIPRTLSFTTAPSSTATSDIAFVQQPVVTVLDAVGNAVAGGKTAGTAGTGVVHLAVSGGTGVLAPAGSVDITATAAGTATFVGLKTNKSGTVTLVASLTDTEGGTITGTSTSIVVAAGAATGFAFRTSPTSSVATNVPFPVGEQPVVVQVDAEANEILTDSSCTVNLTLTGAEVGDQLLGSSLSKTMVLGVADFAGFNLRVLRIGTTPTPISTYKLQATGGGSCTGLTTGAPFLSTAFTVTLAGMPAQLRVKTAPGTSSLNMTWLQQPVIDVLDMNGALVANDNTTSVVMDILSFSGGAPGTLVGSTSMQVQNGEAAFAGLSIPATVAQGSFAGTYTYRFRGFNSPYTITQATASQSINSNGLVPAALQFQIQPQSVAKGQLMSVVQVKTVDANGFFCAFDNASIVTIAAGAGAGFSLSFPTLTVVNGIASFNNMSYSVIGAKTVTATAAGLTSITSNVFSINSHASTADHLLFANIADSTAPTGSPWTHQPDVTVVDAFGNTMTGDNTTIVTLDCVLPITCPTKLIGGVSMRVTNGEANFSGQGLHLGGGPITGIELKATANPVMPVTPAFSNQFNEP